MSEDEGLQPDPWIIEENTMTKEQLAEVVGYVVDESEERVEAEYHLCIETYLEGLNPKEMPRTISIAAWKRAVISFRGMDLLQTIIEDLDCDYGDPDGEWLQSDEAIKAMSKAEEDFHKAIRENYEPYRCDPIPGGIDIVDVKIWIRENRPRWLEEEEFVFSDELKECPSTGGV